MKIIFATGNANKLKEVKEILPEGIEMVSMKEMGFEGDIEETGSTIEENSELKAQFIFEKYGLPTLAEDTGLEVESLNNEPGVYSARYAGKHGDAQANMQLLLKNLTPDKKRSAQFKTVATFITKSASKQYEGIVKGEILEKPTGNEGFGYDPIFKAAGFDLSFAEMTSQEKSLISHRAFAIKRFLKDLKQD